MFGMAECARRAEAVTGIATPRPKNGHSCCGVLIPERH
jgi:hypothetical protein